MTKYLVFADVSNQLHGIEETLFGIFNSKEEAIQWIIDNPTHEFNSYTFDFFERYEDEKKIKIFESRPSVNNLHPRKIVIGTRILSKEEYAEKYIKGFNGSPMYVGFYIEKV